MNRIGDLLLANASKTVRKAGMAAAKEVILRTPVKTGRARINWRVSTRTPKTSVKEGPNTSKVDTNRQVASAEALINASNALKGWKIGSGNIIIANAVSYIGKLDSGEGSTQARQGMTMFAILAARQVLRKGRLLR